MWTPGSERTGDQAGESHVRRRGFIALVCAAGVAGCSEVELPGQGPGDGPTGTPTGTDADTLTPTDEGNGTATETEEPTETTSAETDTETEEPTETLSEEERAARALVRAETHLETAFAAYARQSGSNTSILDVTATATGFSASGITAATDEADTDIAEAEELGTGKQRSRARKLKNVSKFLRGAAPCQTGVTDAYRAFERARNRYREGRDGGLAALDEMQAAWTPVREESLPALKQVNTLGMTAFDPMSSSDANAKIDQFDAEIETFAVLGTPVRQLGEGAATFRSALELYADEEYSDAARAFRDAESTLKDARANSRNIDPAETLRDDAVTLKNVIKVLVEVADSYEDAAEKNDEDAGSGDDDAREAEDLLAENPAAEKWVR